MKTWVWLRVSGSAEQTHVLFYTTSPDGPVPAISASPGSCYMTLEDRDLCLENHTSTTLDHQMLPLFWLVLTLSEGWDLLNHWCWSFQQGHPEGYPNNTPRQSNHARKQVSEYTRECFKERVTFGKCSLWTKEWKLKGMVKSRSRLWDLVVTVTMDRRACGHSQTRLWELSTHKLWVTTVGSRGLSVKAKPNQTWFALGLEKVYPVIQFIV